MSFRCSKSSASWGELTLFLSCQAEQELMNVLNLSLFLSKSAGLAAMLNVSSKIAKRIF